MAVWHPGEQAQTASTRQVGLLGNQCQHGFAIFSQARAAIADHGSDLSMTLSPQTLRPLDRHADADPESVLSFLAKDEGKQDWEENNARHKFQSEDWRSINRPIW